MVTQPQSDTLLLQAQWWMRPWYGVLQCSPANTRDRAIFLVRGRAPGMPVTLLVDLRTNQNITQGRCTMH